MRNLAYLLLAPVMAVALSSCAEQQTYRLEHDRTVYFAFNSDKLSAQSRHTLNDVARILNNDHNIGGVEIVGYADSIGAEDYNRDLSERRAMAVQKYLVARGAEGVNVGDIHWVGETRSSETCGDRETKRTIACLAEDRKVEIMFYDAISEFCSHTNRHCRQD